MPVAAQKIRGANVGREAKLDAGGYLQRRKHAIQSGAILGQKPRCHGVCALGAAPDPI